MIPQVPNSVTKRVTEKGGLAPSGQPLFRILRGSDRLTVVGGRWKKFDASGNQIGETIEEKLAVKYPGSEDRYILEMWCPPENYGTCEDWEREFMEIIDGHIIHTLGPYPAKGEYELVKVIETPKRRLFVPLTSTVVEAALCVAVANRHLPHAIRMEAFRDNLRREESRKNQRQIDYLDNIARPSWTKGPHIIVPGLNSRGKVTLN